MEQPNITYIEHMSGGDKAFEQKLIGIIKAEFPEEKNTYFKNINADNFKEAAENVHKLKHKISILGLEKSYKTANEFEHNLREHSFTRQQDFEKILIAITNYIETI